jgi:DNA-binding transcriptional MerR regulator
LIEQASLITRVRPLQTEAKGRFRIPAKLYRIGEIVRHTPFTRQTIHNYTTMGLIQESDWTEGGHRLYDESVFERLWQIQELRKGKTLTEIQKLLADESPQLQLSS